MSAIPVAAADSKPEKVGVLFDIDGTLCDTNYFHAVCWGEAIWETEHRVVPMSTIHHHIGMGSDKFTTEVLGYHSDAATKAHSTKYEDYWSKVRPFDRVSELLNELKERGVDVVLATSSDGKEFDMLKAAINADDAITAATTSDDVEGSKPDPDIFAKALERGDLKPEGAIVVGDTVWDVRGARAAGLECVGVLSGGISRAELTEAGAIEVYEDIADLFDNLDDSALGRLWNAE